MILLPDNFDAAKIYTGILFAHGIGQRGDGSGVNVETWMKDEAPKLIELIAMSNHILIAPNLLSGKDWTDEYFDSAYSYLLSNYKVGTKVFLDGVSLGGQAIWSWGAGHPDKVLGIHGTAPVFVSVDYCKIKCPVLVHHSRSDPMVGVGQGETAVNNINACGGKAQIKYFGTGHEIWKSDFGRESVYQQAETKTFFGIAGSTVIDPVVNPPAPSPPAPAPSALKADASATQPNVTGTTATLDATRSTGYKGTGSFKDLSWQVKEQPPGSDWNIFPGFIKIGEKIYLKNLSPGQYVFELTARDEKDNVSTDRVTITVTAGKKIFKEITVDGQKITLFEDNSWKVV